MKIGVLKKFLSIVLLFGKKNNASVQHTRKYKTLVLSAIGKPFELYN